MKITLLICVLLWTFSSAISAPFRNLDFQSPNIKVLSVPKPGGGYLVSDVIPGWQLEIGVQVQQFMFYNNVCLSCPSANLNGPPVPRRGDSFGFVMKTGDIINAAVPISIYQTGDVPANARSLLFGAKFSPGVEELHVSLGGQNLEFRLLEFGELSIYGADVTSWAGKTAELRFTAGPVPYGQDAGGVLADIRFSSNPLPGIPEPSTWALLGTGVATLAWNHRRRRRRG